MFYRLLLATLAVISITSCKKTYTCRCYNTMSAAAIMPFTDKEIKANTPVVAEEKCNAYKTDIDSCSLIN